MQKVNIIFLCCLVLLLSACSAKVYKYDASNIEKFDQLIENKLNGVYLQALAYDLRDNCEEGHIDGFTCIKTASNEELTKEDIIELITQYNKDAVIILICEDGRESGEIATVLMRKKYSEIHYFLTGYNDYCLIKGDSFTPSEGCGC